MCYQCECGNWLEGDEQCWCKKRAEGWERGYLQAISDATGAGAGEVVIATMRRLLPIGEPGLTHHYDCRRPYPDDGCYCSFCDPDNKKHRAVVEPEPTAEPAPPATFADMVAMLSKNE